jgi:cbb3-type cytochrome oxidase subunit 3
MTISLLKNLSRINSGSIIGYCNDDVKKFENINLKMFTLFQNSSYHDLSEFNISNLLYLKPLYYDTNLTQSQFIVNDWVINIEINKKTALTLFLIIISLIFIGIFQIWYFYGNCCRIKQRFSLMKKANDEEKFVNNESSYGRKCCGIFLKCISCCGGLYTMFKKKKKKIDDDDDDNIIKLDDFTQLD